jgi:hypothetical protein
MIPEPGDTANIALIKPFLSSDVFKFTARKGYIDIDQAKADLEKIKVVPNPIWQMQSGNPRTHIQVVVVLVQYILLICRVNVR